MPKFVGPLVLILQLVCSSRINFPGDYEYLDRQFRDKKSAGHEPILPCPNGKIFCEDEVEDYPSNIKILDEVVAAKLVRDAIFDDKPKKAGEQILARFGPDSDLVKEARACDNRKATVYPKKATNIQGKYVFIVNDNKYRQAVEIEQCLNEGESCLNESDAPTPGTVCRQKYATYRMYVINEAGEQVYDSFSLPSACLCHHKSDFAIRNAFKTEADSPPLPVCPGPEKLAVSRPSSSSSPVSSSGISFGSSESTTSRPAEQRGTSSKPAPARKPSSNNSGIVFGRRKKRDTNEVFEKPEACADSNNFCEEGNHYPSDVVLKALDANNLSPELFTQLFDNQCKDPIQSRFAIDEEQLCYGVPNVIYPQQAKNLKEEWLYIVNIENYTQSVEIEECYNYLSDFEETTTEAVTTTEQNDDDDSATVMFDQAEDVPEDYGSCLYSGAHGNNPFLTSCKQLYTEHKLLALSNDGQLVVDSFKLPSACACFYKEDFVLKFRRMESEESVDDIDLPEQVDSTLQFD